MLKNGNINLQEIRIKPIIQLWKHCYCYRRNKPEAHQRSNAPRWTFSFNSA